MGGPDVERSRTSVIVRFPARALGRGDPEGKNDARRLAAALTLLERASVEQAQAIRSWRRSLAALRASTETLGASLGAYSRNLEAMAIGARRIGVEARHLANWADGQSSAD